MCERDPGQQLTVQESSTTFGDREFQLGVLLVHGIGTQRPGETLERVRCFPILFGIPESARA